MMAGAADSKILNQPITFELNRNRPIRILKLCRSSTSSKSLIKSSLVTTNGRVLSANHVFNYKCTEATTNTPTSILRTEMLTMVITKAIETMFSTERCGPRCCKHQHPTNCGLQAIIITKFHGNSQTVKPGFHYQSWRPELMARVDGWPVSITCQHRPCWRARVSTSCVAVNMARQLG